MTEAAALGDAKSQPHKPVSVLVFPCGSEIGLEIHRSLAWSKDVELVGASSVTSNHGKYLYKRYIEGLPFVDEPGFLAALNEIAVKEQVQFIYPAHDSVVLLLAQNTAALACQVIGSPVETCQVCRSKALTYQTFAGALRTPRLFPGPESVERFPVFLKPDVGQGSRGTYLAQTEEDVRFYTRLDPSLLILEYLPGNEFTVDCFTDRQGVLRYVGPRLRARIQNGISVDTLPAASEAFHRMAEVINERLALRGGWFFQVKESAGGELALMEIAPRTAGSMALTRNLGVNLPLLSLYDRMGMDVTIQPARHFVQMDRALENHFRTDLSYEHVYVDLDDTLIVNGQVNVMLAAFLYQCLNRGIRRHLITRHPGDLADVLAQHRLNGLFDSLIQLDARQPKAKGITQAQAIFIDDSFRERSEVAQALGIPTFDLDAVESLLDPRR